MDDKYIQTQLSSVWDLFWNDINIGQIFKNSNLFRGYWTNVNTDKFFKDGILTTLLDFQVCVVQCSVFKNGSIMKLLWSGQCSFVCMAILPDMGKKSEYILNNGTVEKLK